MSAKWNAIQAAMSQCLIPAVKEKVCAEVRTRLSRDALLCQSRLGILLEVLGGSTSKSIYLQIVKCADAIEVGTLASDVPVAKRPATKKGRAVDRLRQEGMFSQARQINTASYHKRKLIK